MGGRGGGEKGERCQFALLPGPVPILRGGGSHGKFFSFKERKIAVPWRNKEENLLLLLLILRVSNMPKSWGGYARVRDFWGDSPTVPLFCAVKCISHASLHKVSFTLSLSLIVRNPTPPPPLLIWVWPWGKMSGTSSSVAATAMYFSGGINLSLSSLQKGCVGEIARQKKGGGGGRRRRRVPCCAIKTFDGAFCHSTQIILYVRMKNRDGAVAQIAQTKQQTNVCYVCPLL